MPHASICRTVADLRAALAGWPDATPTEGVLERSVLLIHRPAHAGDARLDPAPEHLELRDQLDDDTDALEIVPPADLHATTF
jgi:hypothetical protein